MINLGLKWARVMRAFSSFVGFRSLSFARSFLGFLVVFFARSFLGALFVFLLLFLCGVLCCRRVAHNEGESRIMEQSTSR